jgi:glycosyltransferase involved in cell wall biosynthesis
MACKVPVVSSNTGGLPELNKEGFSGFLSDVGDIDDMAKNSIYILEDCQRLNEFKENALQRAKDFELSKIVPIYENFYSEVIEKVKKGNISN